jgi:putative holliday junction resolvase
MTTYQPNRISALGLDVGKKRIGVAGCDGTGLIATGLTTIERKSFLEDVARLRSLVQQRQVQVLVVGLPYTLNGAIGSQARQVQKFAQRLSYALQLPVEYVDERLTSVQAEQLLQVENRSPSRYRGLVDRKAAAIILQQWLDERRAAQSRPLLSNPLNLSDSAETVSQPEASLYQAEQMSTSGLNLLSSKVP